MCCCMQYSGVTSAGPSEPRMQVGQQPPIFWNEWKQNPPPQKILINIVPPDFQTFLQPQERGLTVSYGSSITGLKMVNQGWGKEASWLAGWLLLLVRLGSTRSSQLENQTLNKLPQIPVARSPPFTHSKQSVCVPLFICIQSCCVYKPISQYASVVFHVRPLG